MSEAFRVKVHRISPEMIQHVDLARKPDPLSGIIFDLDKTLTNRARTMEAFAVCFRDKFLTAEANILYLQQLFLAADFNGDVERDSMFAELLSQLPWRAPVEMKELTTYYEDTLPFCARVNPGMDKLVRQFDDLNIPIAVITNGKKVRQYRKLVAMGLAQYISVLVASEKVGVAKPKKEIFDITLQRLGIPANQACFIGDDPVHDILGASAAGIPVVWFSGVYPWPREYMEPSYQFSDPSKVMREIFIRQFNFNSGIKSEI